MIILFHNYLLRPSVARPDDVQALLGLGLANTIHIVDDIIIACINFHSLDSRRIWIVFCYRYDFFEVLPWLCCFVCID